MGWLRKADPSRPFVTNTFPNTYFRAGGAASSRRPHIQTVPSVVSCRLPGLEEEVVGNVGLRVQEGLQVALPMYKLTLPQSQAPLLDVHNDWIGQVALHHKQRAENHLKQQARTLSDKLSTKKCN